MFGNQRILFVLALLARTEQFPLHEAQIVKTRAYDTVKKCTEHVLSLLSYLHTSYKSPRAVCLWFAARGRLFPCPADDIILPQMGRKIQW